MVIKINYFFIFLMLAGCKKDIQNNSTPPAPIVYTVPIIDYTNVQSITATSAKCLVNISGNGGKEIIEKGICYSETNRLPSIKDIKLVSSSSLNSFSVDITSLKENTYYYVRSYAVNSIGIAYSEVNKFKTLSATPPPVPSTISDYDGNVYNVIKIGDQYWTKENFRCTHYNDGDEIKRQLIIKDFPGYWNETGAYCYYNDDIELYKKYGALYNWDAAVNFKKLAPKGWHIPTKDEFYKMLLFIYYNPSVDFYLLLGGKRNQEDNKYKEIDEYGYFWNSSQTTVGYNDYYIMYNNYGKIQSIPSSHKIERGPYYKSPGFSVRLVKD